MTFTGMPLPERVFVAAKPSGVQGILIMTFFGSLDFRSIPSSTISFAVRDVTSALIGPGQISAIFRIVSSKSPPDFLIKDGFVVTPSRTPHFEISSTSSIIAESKINSMAGRSTIVISFFL